MNKVLRKQTIKSLLAWIIICAVLAVAALGVSAQGLLMKLTGPTALAELSLEDAEGRYVSFDASEVIVSFATWSANNDAGTKVLATYYLLPYDDSYIAVMDSKENNARILERAMEQSQQYYMADLETLTKLGDIAGTVKPLEADMEEYMVKCIENYTLPGYVEGGNTYDLLLPYQVNLDQVGFLYTKAAVILGIVGLVFLMLTLGLLIPALTGAYQKKANAVLSEKLTAEEADAAFNEAETIEKIRVGKYIWYQKGAITKVLSTADLIWGYSMPEPLVVSKYRWPVALYDQNQKFTQICFMEKKNREKFLSAIAAQRNPFIDVYTSELGQKFKNDPEGFAKEAAKAAKERNHE